MRKIPVVRGKDASKFINRSKRNDELIKKRKESYLKSVRNDYRSQENICSTNSSK